MGHSSRKTLGAALTRSYVENDLGEVFDGDVRYAKDAFEGLAVLPEFDALVVDEAHELQDRVTGAVTGQLSGAIVQAAADGHSLRRIGEAANLSHEGVRRILRGRI